MKFLPPEMESDHIIPLNFIYDRGTDYGNDTLTIIFKDVLSGMKSAYTIKQPVIEAYIVKPEYRNFGDQQSLHWYPIDKCTVHKVKYMSRYYEAAKILGLNSAEDARLSPYVYGLDLEVENFYLIQFVKEYPCKYFKTISMGYFDIENDIIRLNRFPEYGEVPINAVTYIDGTNRWVYTLILARDDIPVVSTKHPQYVEYEELRESFYRQLNELKRDIPGLIKELHEEFDENFGQFEYSVIFVENEIELIRTFWDIVKAADNDYVYAWNDPYDLQHMMTRPGVLNYDVNQIIPDERILRQKENATVSFYEDKNPKVAKRKHKAITWTLQTFLDHMVVYAGIRAGRGELASTKLNYVAQLELKDEKFDYSEDGDIRTLFYRNLLRFIKYNIKDVLLEYGIEEKTKDIQTIYSRMYELFVTPEQSFTTTKVVLHALFAFALEHGYILGQNRNKGHKNNPSVNYGELFGGVTEDVDEDEFFYMLFGEDDADDSDDSDEKSKIREKYDGAFVMNPLYMSPTGVKIRGKDSQFVHDDVADSDVGSEYPTEVVISNISSETLLGKVYLEGDSITIPLPDVYEFRGDEGLKYKMDISNYFLESYSQRDFLSFGKDFLNLPDVSEVMNMIDKGEV